MISILATFPPIVCVILSFSFVPVFVLLWFSSFGYVYRHAWFRIHCDSRLLFCFFKRPIGAFRARVSTANGCSVVRATFDNNACVTHSIKEIQSKSLMRNNCAILYSNGICIIRWALQSKWTWRRRTIVYLWNVVQRNWERTACKRTCTFHINGKRTINFDF